jgi:hypothetical protein
VMELTFDEKKIKDFEEICEATMLTPHDAIQDSLTLYQEAIRAVVAGDRIGRFNGEVFTPVMTAGLQRAAS